jgi:hypothetical protein
MQRMENAEYFHAKQACYLCGQPHDVVDTEIQIVGEGVLCICHGCIADLARTSRFDLTDRRDEIDQLQADLAKANAQGFQHYPTLGPTEPTIEPNILRDPTGLIEYDASDDDFEAVIG